MWQIVAVILTGIATVAYVIYKIYRLVVSCDKKPCAGCTDCTIKKQMSNKRNCPGCG
jgi:hypothetical protein